MPGDSKKQAELILSAYHQKKSSRGTWEGHWQQIADFCLGRRDFVTQFRSGGRKRQHQIYNGTFQEAADELAAFLEGSMINPAARWFKIAPEDKNLLEVEENRLWYEAVTDAAYHAFNRPQAEWAAQSHETLLDVVAFGTGGMYIDSKPGDGIFFSSRPLGEIFIGESAEGRVNSVDRRYFLTPQQAVDEFGEENVSDHIRKEVHNSDTNSAKMEFVHSVLLRDHVPPKASFSSHFKWASFHIEVEQVHVVRESGYHELPYMVPRWTKDAGELYGRGPGIAALPDARVLNRMEQTMLAAAEKAVAPPLIVADDGVISPIRTSPNGINVVRQLPGGTEPIRYLQNGARFDVSDTRMEKLEAQVRSKFYNQSIEQFRDPNMSATQVIEIASRTSQRIGPQIFRLQSGWLEPAVERVAAINDRAGMHPPRPAGLRGLPFRVDYMSPAQMAQRSTEVQSILGITGAAIEWGQLDQDVLDNIDFDKALKRLDEAFRDTGVLRPEDEVRAIRDAKNQQAAQQQAEKQQMDQMAALGKAAPALQSIQGGRQ